MKAKLSVDNVGGLKGHNQYEFESGKLSIIEASNASGKSSLVKALASVLSMPSDGEMTPFVTEEAKQIGIKSDEKSHQEGFVNLHAKMAEVQLDLGKEKISYKVDKDGKWYELPLIGNESFLLAGILSKDCKVLRQLRAGDDDFNWAVTYLSFAKYYDQVKDLAVSRKELIEVGKYR